MLTLRVRDDGVGIDPAVMGNPTSLGLVGMLERAADAGGTVNFNSSTGRGTEVVLTLPISGQARAGARHPAMRILIIDDHAIVRRGMISILREHFTDADFGECENARVGISAVMDEVWDLVIVDVSMPGRTGLDFIQDIRRARPGLPVLVVSAHSEKDYAVRALKLGAAGFVSKQVAGDVLVSAVKRVLSGGKYVSPSLAEHLAGSLAGGVPDGSHDALSNRELQVLKMIASGKTIKEIGAELALSEKTIATYRARISEKMGLPTNVDLTRYAMRHGLVE